MGVDYEQQLLDNEAEKKTAIDNSNAAYDQTISDYEGVVKDQQQQLEANKEEQTRLQQEQTDFAIDKINQQREQAEKDYTKEQQAAYGDYKRQTDPYGANAEQMAALGLSQSGYSESSNVAMYTAYQNRVATARASFEQAKQTFANAIQEAKLTNDVNKAKIAAETLQQSLKLAMESVVYLGSLQQEKAANARAIEQTYYDRAQDIRDAQAAEIARAQQESMFSITGNEGNADFTAIDTIFGDGVSDDAVAQMIADGVIAAETVNGVTVYKVADEEKARTYMAEQTGDTAPGGTEGTAGGGQTEQPKYNYSDERVNAYFEQKDAVEALQKEYNHALNNLNLLRDKFANPAVDQEGVKVAFNAQQEYVNKLRKQLRAAHDKLENMPKPTESFVYLSRDSACKQAKKTWETASHELSAAKESGGSAVSTEALEGLEEKVRIAQQAYNKAYAALMSVERYIISGSSGEGPSGSWGGLVGSQVSLR